MELIIIFINQFECRLCNYFSHNSNSIQSVIVVCTVKKPGFPVQSNTGKNYNNKKLVESYTIKICWKILLIEYMAIGDYTPEFHSTAKYGKIDSGVLL